MESSGGVPVVLLIATAVPVVLLVATASSDALYSVLTARQVAHGTVEAAGPSAAGSHLAASWRMPRTTLLTRCRSTSRINF